MDMTVENNGQESPAKSQVESEEVNNENFEVKKVKYGTTQKPEGLNNDLLQQTD